MIERARLACLHSGSPTAASAFDELNDRHRFVPPDEADVIVARGGDGFMLHVLHQYLGNDVAVYGMNRGTFGFLINEYRPGHLTDRVTTATEQRIVPLRALATTVAGEQHELIAINEVSLIRSSVQAAKLRIFINEVERLEQLTGYVWLGSTPAGSTAYNLSARGPVVPLGSGLMALTPVSPFRPRRWHGALVPHDACIRIDVLDPGKRPVAAGADSREIREVAHIEIGEASDMTIRVLFDPGHSLEERILTEQFE